jgi:hypothetical protein
LAEGAPQAGYAETDCSDRITKQLADGAGHTLVKRRLADPVLAADVRRLHPCLLLAQDRDDLFFREPRSLIVRLLPVVGLYSNLAEIRGLRSRAMRADVGRMLFPLYTPRASLIAASATGSGTLWIHLFYP